MYHYVRDLANSRYPDIKGLDIALFKEQIEFFISNYNIITPELLLDAIQNNAKLPRNSVLLTFDDGYIDHYTVVFPILKKYRLSAIFSMPAKILAEHKVLDVNKIHFLLASTKIDTLLRETFKLMDYYRGAEYVYPANRELFEKLAHPSRFDTAEVIFIKRVLQVELPETLRNKITDELFKRHIGVNERAFSHELYMSMDQVKLMQREGMYFGVHGYEHYWMNRLEDDALIKDIDRVFDVFSDIMDKDRWICCYPYGSFSDKVRECVKKKGAVAGLGTVVGIADISVDDPLLLPRLDTNDYPPKSTNYLSYSRRTC